MARICLWLVCEGINISWLIYGNIVFWEKETPEVAKCKKDKNYAIRLAMFIMIMVGYIYFAFYALIICLFIFMKIRLFRSSRSPQRRNSLSNEEMLRKLSRVKYSEEEFGPVSDDNECIICMTPFKLEDTITRLECPGQHFYHTRCIELWIRQGNHFCPVCRHHAIGESPPSPNQSIEMAPDQSIELN